MKDIAHELTDEMLFDLEKKLKELYTEAYKQCREKTAESLEKMQSLPADATPQQRYNAAVRYERLKKLEEQLTDILANTNKEAMAVSQAEWYKVYVENYNFGAYIVETGSGNLGVYPLMNRNIAAGVVKGEFTPFTMLALDDIKNKQSVRMELTRQLVTGISLGESMTGIAKRIKSVVERNLSDAVRIARTETTRIENEARADAFKIGKEKYGFEQEKEWVSTLDSRTRDTHAEADGQRVPIDGYFTVGGEKMKAPGDSAGGAKNVVNCRCTMVTHIKGMEKFEKDRITYQKWQEARKDGLSG